MIERIAKFAEVTVGHIDGSDARSLPPEPQILLNDWPPRTTRSEHDFKIIEAAREGIRETEVELRWQGTKHFLISIQGLAVDGIDPDSARIAARNATKELIQG